MQPIWSAVFFLARRIVHANTGFIGSGFAQAGMWGVFAYAVGAGLIVSILQTYSRYLGVPLVAAAMLIQFASMISATDFVTLFLTHGLFLALVILTLVHKQKQLPTARPKRCARFSARHAKSDIRCAAIPASLSLN